MKKRFSFSKIFVYLVLVVIILFFTVTTDTFLTSKNILNICRQISMIGICSVGMTMVLLTGGMVGVAAAKLIGEAGMAIFPAMLIGVAAGALCGLINGIMVAKFDVPALITTLAMQTMARGAAYILTSGIPIYGLPEEIKTLGQGYFFKIPIPVIIMALIFLFGWWLLEQTRFGRYTYAIGGNQEVARLSGINVLKMKIFIYTLSGLFAGLSGVIMLSRINSGQPATSSGFEMDVITGAVLGGISVAGGEGKLVNVIAGVLIMGMLSNGMTLMNLDEYWQWVVKGIVLLLAVTFDNMQRKRNAKVKL